MSLSEEYEPPRSLGDITYDQEARRVITELPDGVDGAVLQWWEGAGLQLVEDIVTGHNSSTRREQLASVVIQVADVAARAALANQNPQRGVS